MPKAYFRCNTNPAAPLLVLDAEWEFAEQRRHPDYDEVDEDGLPVLPPPPAVEAQAA
jgi:hypothetical protein